MPQRSKLSLNQETLRNMTPNQLRAVVGGALSVPHVNCLTGLSCPECNPPGREEEKPQEDPR